MPRHRRRPVPSTPQALSCAAVPTSSWVLCNRALSRLVWSQPPPFRRLDGGRPVKAGPGRRGGQVLRHGLQRVGWRYSRSCCAKSGAAFEERKPAKRGPGAGVQASIAPGRLDGASAPLLHRRPRLPGTLHGRVHCRCASWGPRRRGWLPRTWLISHPPPPAPDTTAPSSRPCTAQTCSLSWDPPRFNAEKLSVRYLDGSSGPTAGASSPAGTLRRRYTLTHNDLTGELTLSVGREYNAHQVTGWYVRSKAVVCQATRPEG
jgi:hypothetical protein